MAKGKVECTDVYSDESEEQNEENPEKPKYVDCSSVTYENLKQGSFVVVTYELASRKYKCKNFVAIVQSEIDENREVFVSFLKSSENDKSVYFINENDSSYISYDQIKGLLPNPQLIEKGIRLFYKFKNPVNL